MEKHIEIHANHYEVSFQASNILNGIENRIHKAVWNLYLPGLNQTELMEVYSQALSYTIIIVKH